MKGLFTGIFSFSFLIQVHAAQVVSSPSNGSDTSPKQNTSVPAASNDPALLLNDIKGLRAAGKLHEAESAARLYLNKYPDDVDGMLLLGLICIQQQKDSEGEFYLNKVLLKKPDYIDARTALIRLYIKNNQSQEARNLIEKGLEITPNQADLLLLQKKLIQPEPHAKTTKKTAQDNSRILSEIKELKRQNKLSLAKEKAVNYLKNHPDDLDMLLMLGLIYYAQHDYQQSEIYLKKVLKSTPGYVDARIALVNIKLAHRDYKGARILLDQGLIINPKDQQLALLNTKLRAATTQKRIYGKNAVKKVEPWTRELQQAKKLLAEKRYNEASAIYKRLVQMDPGNVDFQIALTDYYLARHRDQAALTTVRRALVYNPYNVKLLDKKGEVHTILHQYDLAAKSYQKALVRDPNNKNTRNLLNEIAGISPRHLYGLNEIGIWSDNAYVPDLHSVWDWSNIYLARETDWGRAVLQVGYASRQGVDGEQYGINLLPRINRNIYFDLAAAYSEEPALFPSFMSSGEGYFNIPNLFELSAGGKYSRIKQTYFNTYTGSINFYPGNWWLSFRPYYFAPQTTSRDSVLYTAKVRRYFATDDHYIGLGAGTGHSPDLADLLTVNFLVIQNSFVNVNYTFPVLNHHILVDLGMGYQHWVYPSNLVRKLYDASIGFRYKF